MTRAYILILTGPGRGPDVAAAVGTIPGVTSAESVTGPYDVVVQVEGRSLADISSRVVGAIHLVEGVTRTLTCPAVGMHRSRG